MDQTYAALVTPPEDTNMLIMPTVRTVRNISLGSKVPYVIHPLSAIYGLILLENC